MGRQVPVLDRPLRAQDIGSTTPWPAQQFQINIVHSGMAPQPSSPDNMTDRVVATILVLQEAEPALTSAPDC